MLNPCYLLLLAAMKVKSVGQPGIHTTEKVWITYWKPTPTLHPSQHSNILQELRRDPSATPQGWKQLACLISALITFHHISTHFPFMWWTEAALREALVERPPIKVFTAEYQILPGTRCGNKSFGMDGEGNITLPGLSALLDTYTASSSSLQKTDRSITLGQVNKAERIQVF